MLSYNVRRRTLLSLGGNASIQEKSSTLPGKIELVSGLATGILAICAPFVLSLPFRNFLGYILISVVVAGASYLHVVLRMIAGFVIVLIAGGMVGIVGVVGAAIVAVSGVDNWTMVLIYVPGWTAFITVIASIITQLRRSAARERHD